MLTGRRAIRILTALAAFAAASCSVTRHIPEGEYLLTRNRVETDKQAPREERITASEFEKYIRQKPARKLLGTNINQWIYATADPAKNNWWNRFKRRIGTRPVLLDTALTVRSAENLKIYMNSRGFFSSTSTFSIDTTSHPKKAEVTYSVHQGQPYRIARLRYDFRDKFLEPIIMQDTAARLVREGDIFDITVLAKERSRIASYLNDRGYYNFTVDNILYRADTLAGDHQVDLTLEVKQYLAGYDAKGRAEMENNRVYRIRDIRVNPNYDPTVARTDSAYIRALDTLEYRGLQIVYDGKLNLRRKVLRQIVDLYPNYLYDYAQVRHTYDNIMRLGYFRSASILFSVLPADSSNLVSYIGSEEQAADSAVYTQEGYLSCNILCTPSLRQSYKIELEGSTTSNFYGLKATLGYQNRNLFRGAELFDASFYAGYEFMKGTRSGKKTAFEIGGSASLAFPRFILPFRIPRSARINNPRTKVELSINGQNRPYYRRTLSSAAWGYTWSNGRYSSFAVRPIDLNLIKMGYVDVENFLNGLKNEYLRNSYTSQLSAGISGNWVYNNQLRDLEGNASVVRVNWETAGNLVGALSHLLSSPARGKDYYNIFGIRYSQYFRVDASFARKEVLGARTAIAYRLYGGLAMAYGNAVSVPFDRLFYAGGSNSMRGWSPRTLGPGSVPYEHSDYPSQLGDMKLEANLEFRFPIWGIFHGALFFDAGNIWFVKSKAEEYNPASVFHFKDFYKQLGFDTGLGIRLDIKFAVLRFDWGIKLYDPNQPVRQRWIQRFRMRNTVLNFGVGYPF